MKVRRLRIFGLCCGNEEYGRSSFALLSLARAESGFGFRASWTFLRNNEIPEFLGTFMGDWWGSVVLTVLHEEILADMMTG